jgi:hypothetical protein
MELSLFKSSRRDATPVTLLLLVMATILLTSILILPKIQVKAKMSSQE